jgi:hypothetical protein
VISTFLFRWTLLGQSVFSGRQKQAKTWARIEWKSCILNSPPKHTHTKQNETKHLTVKHETGKSSVCTSTTVTTLEGIWKEGSIYSQPWNKMEVKPFSFFSFFLFLPFIFSPSSSLSCRPTSSSCLHRLAYSSSCVCIIPSSLQPSGHDRFLRNPFQFIIYPSFYHLMLHTLDAESVVK